MAAGVGVTWRPDLLSAWGCASAAVEAAEAAVVAALGVLAATVVFDFALGPLGVLAACVLKWRVKIFNIVKL